MLNLVIILLLECSDQLLENSSTRKLCQKSEHRVLDARQWNHLWVSLNWTIWWRNLCQNWTRRKVQNFVDSSYFGPEQILMQLPLTILLMQCFSTFCDSRYAFPWLWNNLAAPLPSYNLLVNRCQIHKSVASLMLSMLPKDDFSPWLRTTVLMYGEVRKSNDTTLW